MAGKIIAAIILVAGLAATPAATADAIRLATGEVIIGEIEEAGFEKIQVRSVFPAERRLTLTASEIAPESHYAILATRLAADDPQARLRLARFCIARGLLSYATVEAERAAKLDAALGEEAEGIRRRAIDGIAERLLDEARTYIAVDHPERARLYLRSIAERYPEAKSAAEAKRLLRRLPKPKPPKEVEPITSARKKATIRRTLKAARTALERGDKTAGSLERHFGRDRRTELHLRRAEPYFKRAFLALKKAAAIPTDDEALNGELRRTAATARSRLTKLYLALGRIYLARGAVDLADRLCSWACEIEPENKETHELHEKVLETQIRQSLGV